MNHLQTPNAWLKVDFPDNPATCRLLVFKGEERINASFYFELHLLMLEDRSVEDMLTRAVTVTIDERMSGQRRYFHGCVSQWFQGARAREWYQYRAVLVPRLTLLANQCIQTRAFYQQPLRAIIEQVLKHYQIQFKANPAASLDSHYAYCVQYRETDWNFIKRLLATESLHYYFDHTEQACYLGIFQQLNQAVDAVLPHSAALTTPHLFDLIVSHQANQGGVLTAKVYGHLFSLNDGLQLDSRSQGYPDRCAITGITHHAVERQTGFKSEVSQNQYQQTISMQPPQQTLVKATNFVCPKQANIEPAKVVESDLGQVRLQFPWEASSVKLDDRPWAALALNQGAAAWLHQWKLHIGDKVWVKYLYGDPNKPVVIACYYPNAVAPPWPHHLTRSGFLSKNATNGNTNAIYFEDDAKQAHVAMRSGKTIQYNVGYKASININKNHQQAVKREAQVLVKQGNLTIQAAAMTLAAGTTTAKIQLTRQTIAIQARQIKIIY